MKIKKKSAKTKRKNEMPRWMRCSWHRVACGKDDCPICGRIKRDRQKHIEKGEDPDDIKCVLEDVGNTFRETLALVKKDAEKFGIDIENIEDIQEPPEPEEFPLHKEVMEWHRSVYSLAQNSETAPWMHTEDAEDLFWYANTVCAKTYRQLCNRWHIENGDDYGDFDYEYTKEVLRECFNIIQKALTRLIPISSKDKVKLMFISDGLLKLRKEVLKI